MRFRRSRRAVVAASFAVLLPAVPAAAADRARLYEIDGARDVLARTMIARTGAAIVEVDHARVVAGMTRREVRRVRRLGYGVHRLRLPQRPARRERPARADERLPGGRLGVPQLQRDGHPADQRGERLPGDRAARQPRHLARGATRLRAQGLRQRRFRRGRAGGDVHRQPARARAPDGRDGALPARRADIQVRDRCPDRQRRELARDLDRPDGQPGRRRVRHRHRRVPPWRKNRQPNAGSSAVGTDLNRNWGYRWGCCGGSQRHVLARRPTAARAPSRRRRPATCATSSTARDRRRPADQGEHRLPHLRGARAVAVRLHAAPTCRPTCAPTTRPCSHVRPGDGEHERLHPAAGVATSTSPTARSTTGSTAPTGSSPTRSRCTRGRRTRASIRPTR